MNHAMIKGFSEESQALAMPAFALDTLGNRNGNEDLDVVWPELGRSSEKKLIVFQKWLGIGNKPL
jgi:hypothetical protein